jgi:hypothetical protein
VNTNRCKNVLLPWWATFDVFPALDNLPVN